MPDLSPENAAERAHLPAIARAHAIAAQVHAAQNYQGKGYYEHHVLPVAQAVRHHGPVIYIAALLHDVIEDSAAAQDPDARFDAARLLREGIPAQSVDIVVAVTRIPGEPYRALIERSASTLPSALVKWADNRRNLAACNEDGNTSLAKRYITFGQVLEQALTAHGIDPATALSR